MDHYKFLILLCLDSLLKLDIMLIELKHIAADWKKLGGHLGFSDSDMDIFQHATQGVDFDCLVELFEVYMVIEEKETNLETYSRCIEKYGR